jgi:hypothetical protein
MKFVAWSVSLLLSLLSGCTTTNGLNEFSLTFATKDIQAVIDKAPRSKSLVDGLVVVSVEGTPVVKIGEPDERIGIALRLAVQVLGYAPVTATIKGSTKLVYVETQKAFFLDDPIVSSVEAPYLPKIFEGDVANLAKEQITKVVNTTPIYVLPENGSMQQKAVRRMLKTIRIQPDQIIATFALQ